MPCRRYAPAPGPVVAVLAVVVAVVASTVGLPGRPAHAAGTAYFVSPTGSDSAAGTSAGSPFKTLQKALDLAQPGTTITLAPGTYKQAVITKVAGTAAAPITIKGPETGKTVGERDKAVLHGTGGRVFSIDHSHYTLDGFTIDGQERVARSSYPSSFSQTRSFKDSVQTNAVNSKLVYVGASGTSADIVGITISNMFLTGSGGECVRFRNRAANSLVVNSLITWCGMYGSGDGSSQYKYHNAEGVYVGTSPKSTTQPMYQNDTSNNIVVRDSTIDTYGSECFNTKENAHHNRIENSVCRYNDEPSSFSGSNIEFRGDHNLVLNTQVRDSKGWNVKLVSDSATYDRGGNSVERSTLSGAAGAAIYNRQSTTGSSYCGNTISGTRADASPSIGDPTRPCADGAAPTAPAGLTATAASDTSVALSWTAATDDVGVTSYGVLRDGVQVGTTAGLTYTDTGLAAATAYTYTVVARDAVNNTSPPSAPVGVTTTGPPPTTTTTTPPPTSTTPPPTTTTTLPTTTTTPPTTTTTPPTTTTTTPTTTTTTTTTPPPTTTTPPPAQVVVAEAESGTVVSPMAVRSDSTAQGRRYVSQTSGSRAGSVTVRLTVPAAGRYAVALRVYTYDRNSDSFTVKVNSEAASVWELGTRRSWTWVTGPTVALPAGTTTVVVTNRENNTELDAVRLTRVP